jgi:hypothetical protein
MGQTDWCTCPDYAIDPACPKHGRTPEIANADAEEELTYATITPTPADLAVDKEVTLTLTVEDALTLHATINEKVDALSAAIVARQLTTEEAVTATTRLKRCLIAFNDALVAVIGGRTGTELQDACMALSDAERERLMEESIMRGMAQR